MKLPDILVAYSRSDRTTAVAVAGFLIATIAFADSRFQPGFSLGFFYLIPILIAALYVSRTELFVLAATCTALREILGPFENDFGIVVRSGIGMLAYFGSGLFVEELARRRRRTIKHLKELEEQMKLRHEAEEQLRVLIETSPAAILTVDGDGGILLANQAAHQMLGCEDAALSGQPVSAFLPVLADLRQAQGEGRLLRTAVECRGRRANGEAFPAHIWLSTYSTQSGSRLAAIVLDTSEELRDREELGLSRLMASSRILVRAVSHEIRNLCAAIGVVRTNLLRVPGINENEDFQALGTLVDGLGRLASSELRSSPANARASLNLGEVLDELRIIIDPAFHEEDAAVMWEVPEDLPPVCGDKHGLLHVFMNLVRNSQRALRTVADRRLTISASAEGDRVTVRFIDTGPGVARPDRLFQAFQQSADGAGLGLYLSRALMRSFSGDLRYEARPAGCCFSVELARAAEVKTTTV